MKKQLVKIISLFTVFVLLCCPVLHLFANALSATAEVVSAKIDPDVMAAFADGAETVEVYVWLNDIDQKQVDAIVEQKTGLRADNLAVIDENISNDLAARIVSEADNDKLTDETEKLLQDYLDRTAAQRTQERERTDLYTATRRAEAKAKYNQKSASFLAKNSISNEKVIFNSNYAPMLILELTKQEVKSIAARADVESVTLHDNLIPIVENTIFIEESSPQMEEISTIVTSAPSVSEGLNNLDMQRIKTISGLDGSGVKIGVVDYYSIDQSAQSTIEYFGNRIVYSVGTQAPNYMDHVYKVSIILASEEGVANGASIYSVGYDGGTNIYQCIENLLSENVSIISMSLGFSYNTTDDIPTYDTRCAWYDHLASTHGIVFVKSAGNKGDTTGYVTSPGIAENIITVGCYKQNISSDGNFSNQMISFSSYLETNGVAKPDVVALGRYNIFTSDDTLDQIRASHGTSLAAPVVAGIVGILFELRPSLTAYPHIVKAIIMASCHEKALPALEGENAETMSAGLTEKQGAGIVNPFIAVAIASCGTYGFGILESEISTERVKFQQSIADTGSLNVIVTWLREVTANETDHPNGTATASARRDLDIRLVSNGSIIGYSTKSNTSAEMVYTNFTNGANNNYEIVVNRFGSSTEDIRYAYAWSVNSMRFQYNQPFEGIGYLKNLNSSYYMEADTTALTMSQQTFDGDFNQMWILRRNANASTYKLQSAYGTIGSVADSSSISNSSASAVTVSLNDDGTYSFIRTNGSTQYILGISNNATTAGAGAVWQLKGDTVSDSQKWYFELCAYERGDYDKSGTINAEDARLILRASVGIENPDTMQAFLADVDGNGVLEASDARLANRYAVGLDP